MRQGLYKVNFHTVHGTGCGVVYVTDGKMRGGNSAFAFIGTYVGEGDSIKVKISTQRYNDDPSFKPLFGHDRITLTLAGRTATRRNSKAPRCRCRALPSGPCSAGSATSRPASRPRL